MYNPHNNQVHTSTPSLSSTAAPFSSIAQVTSHSSAGSTPQLMAQLENNLDEVSTLAEGASESIDEEDKQAAEQKISQLKGTLLKMKDQVMVEAVQAEGMTTETEGAE